MTAAATRAHRPMFPTPAELRARALEIGPPDHDRALDAMARPHVGCRTQIDDGDNGRPHHASWCPGADDLDDNLVDL